MSIDAVRIYVLWHQQSAQGQHYAEAIYHWFRGKPDDLTEAGYGIPVHYRFHVAGDNAHQDPYDARNNDQLRPAEIQWDQAEVNIVVPLLDELMVTHAGWRRYLKEIAKKEESVSETNLNDQGCSIRTFPVKLHPAAHNVSSRIASRNYIRIDSQSDPAHWQRGERLAAQTDRLLSRLTQAVSRLLERIFEQASCAEPQTLNASAQDHAHGQPDVTKELKVFVSHAKVDGTQIATTVRDGLLHAGQVQAFFDESDLPWGEGYEQPLGGAARGSGTAAMIAVYTDAYAGRQWCQRELRAARTPFAIDNAKRRWTHKPLVILDALQGARTRYLGEVGQAPVIRWDESRVSAIIDLLLREVMLTTYQRLWSRRLRLDEERSGDTDADEQSRGTYAFAGYIDLHVASHIKRKIRDSQEPGKDKLEELRFLLVPPPGPTAADRAWLESMLPDTTIKTFSEFEVGNKQDPPKSEVDDKQDPPKSEVDGEQDSPKSEANDKQDPPESTALPRVIGVSISKSPDLSTLGFGDEHLQEIMLSVARMLLRSGTQERPVQLAYGGDLRPEGFTQTLFDLAQAECQGGKHGRMYSYIAWPHYHDLSPEQEAQMISSCDVLRITPKDAGLDTAASKTPADLAEATAQAVTSNCITALRRCMTHGGKHTLDGYPVPKLTARVIFGGKREDYTGIMPGIFEEFLLAQEHDVPVYIMGGFGGAAGDLADAILGSGALDPVFSLEYQQEHTPGVAKLDVGDAYVRLEAAILHYRNGIGQDASPNGLSREDNDTLMRSTSMSDIAGLILRGINTCEQRH